MTDEQSRRITPSDKNTSTSEYVPVKRSSVDETGETITVSYNPKDIAAVGRCPLWLVPPEARRQEARVLEHGAAKYGPYNWRSEPILLSTYLSATERHLAAFIDGQDIDGESGLSHLAHARATLGIIIDAMTHGKVIDDRP